MNLNSFYCWKIRKYLNKQSAKPANQPKKQTNEKNTVIRIDERNRKPVERAAPKLKEIL